jgi:hypothetical protein
MISNSRFIRLKARLLTLLYAYLGRQNGSFLQTLGGEERSIGCRGTEGSKVVRGRAVEAQWRRWVIGYCT